MTFCGHFHLEELAVGTLKDLQSEGTVAKVVRQIRDLGQQGVQFATFPGPVRLPDHRRT